MYSNLKSDEKRRQEVISCLYWSMMQNWNIQQSMQDYFGLTEDYRLYHQLEDMDPAIYRQKRAAGEIPDVLEVDARLTRAVEKIFESICERPPVPYLNKLNEELEKLGQIAALPDNVNDTIHIRLDFLAKYGIDRKASSEECSAKAEKAYRELDARFVKMTGRRPYANELFNGMKKRQSDSSEERPSRKQHIRHKPKSKGRKMGL